MTNLDQLDTEALTAYLTACGGSDTFRLWDEIGQPDVAAARRLAEGLRGRLGGQLGHLARVEQTVNRVVISLVLEPARV
jgi:hypothetical protein